MSRVFVVQAPARREGPRGEWVEKFDLEPARAFGELVRVLGYGNLPTDLTEARRTLTEALGQFDFTSDHLLLLGDPVAIALSVSVLTALQMVDDIDAPIRVLKWDRRAGCYESRSLGG
jgi:hypothetical protein